MSVSLWAVLLGGLLVLARLVWLERRVARQGQEMRQLAQVRALIDVTNALVGETDLNSTLSEVTVLACKLLNAKAAALELLSDDGATLELKAAAGLPSSAIGLQFLVAGSFTGWVVQHGKPRASVDPMADPFVQQESKELLGHSPTAAAPLWHRGRPLGAIACISERPFTPDDLELLRAMADQAAMAIENARLFQEVHALSITDPLTRLANRRQLERDLAREFAAARRGRRLVAVMFDLNGFKAYNDQYGHLAGDQVLCGFADALKTVTRAMNLAARYGGDEFVALLADSDLEGARIFVKHVCSEFEQFMLSLGRGKVTATAGIAQYSPDMKSPEELLDAADRALYDLKGVRAST